MTRNECLDAIEARLRAEGDPLLQAVRDVRHELAAAKRDRDTYLRDLRQAFDRLRESEPTLAALRAEVERLRAERDALINNQVRPIGVSEYYRLPGNIAYQVKQFVPPPASFWNTRDQAVAAVRRAAGLPPSPDAGGAE